MSFNWEISGSKGSSPAKKRSKLNLDKFKRSEGSCFSDLPDEMVERILDFAKEPVQGEGAAEGRQNQSIRLVCRRWNKIFTPKILHTGELKEDTIHSFVQLNPRIKFKRLVVSNLKSNRVRKCLATRTPVKDTDLDLPWTKSNGRFGGRDYDPRLFARAVEHLIVGGEAGVFLKKHRPGVKLPYSMSTGFAEDHQAVNECLSSVNGTDLANIISKLTGVKTLTFSSVAFLSMSEWHLRKLHISQHFRTLSTLDLCIGQRTDPDKLAILLEKSHFPTLSALYIRLYSLCFHCSLFINFYRFISKHPHLKELSLSQAQAIYGLPEVDHDNSEYQISSYPEIVENLMKIKLKFLRMDCLIIGHRIGQQWKDLELAFVKNQTQLQGLELQINLRYLPCRLDQVLPPCQETLERLELTSCNTTPNHFDCSTISTFCKLEEFHLYLRNFFGAVPEEDVDSIVKILNIHALPPSVKNIHLGRIPSFEELEILAPRLLKLKRVSYSCSDSVIPQARLDSPLFMKVLLAHLNFPSLTEFKMNQYTCSTVVAFIHRQSGMVAYIEDNDSIVVLVDRDNINFEEIRNEAVLGCKCHQCHAVDLFSS